MAENSCLATSTAPASHSYKAFSLSSGDAATSFPTTTPNGGQNDTGSFSYSRNNANNQSETVSDFARRVAAVSDSSMNASNYPSNRPNSDYIHMSIDDICNKARQLINKDTFPTSSFELGLKDKAMVSKYVSSSDSYRTGFNFDVDNLIRKYSNPSYLTSSYSNRYNIEDNQYSGYKENDINSYTDDITKSKSSIISGSNVQSMPSNSTRNVIHPPERHERRSKEKKSKRSSGKNQLLLSPSKTNMVKHQRKSSNSMSHTMDDQSPNNNVIRFMRCYPDSDQQGGGGLSGNDDNRISMKRRPKNDGSNNSCMCHKPKVPCPVHDTAKTSMSHGQFSGVTNDCPPSVECSCAGTNQEASNIEQISAPIPTLAPGPSPVPDLEQPMPEVTQSATEAKMSKSKKKVQTKKKAGSRHFMINEAKRVYKENELLKAEGMYLRNELECTRKGLIMECAKVLHSVLTFCDEKAQKKKKICHDNVKTTAPKCSCSRMV